MTNPYLALTTYEGSDWKSHLESICLLDVFGELFRFWQDPESMRKIIRYIVWTYSRESNKYIAGMEWEKNKRDIYRQAGLPENMWTELGLLKDMYLLRAIHNWLDFQGESVHKQLMTLKDLKLEMQLSCLLPISKSTEGVDYDQKMKNIKYANELDDMIQKLEARQIQNDPRLKEAVKEARYSRNVLTGPEQFAK